MESTATISNNSATDGVAGGAVSLGAAQDFVFAGAIDTTGDDISAGAGSAGGNVSLSAVGALYADGTIVSSGGSGDTGGLGGAITLSGSTREICNSAALTANGGDGAQNAGNGGSITLGQLSYSGPGVAVRNQGMLTTRGGAQTGVCVSACRAGIGGSITLRAPGLGEISNSGDLDTRGVGAVDGIGGNGGDVRLRHSFMFRGSDAVTKVLHHQVSGNITTFGGDGTVAGGGGGDVSVRNDGAPGSGVTFLGYPSANLPGGDSVDGTGGRGGSVEAFYAGGEGGAGVFIYVDINAVGGTSTNGTGGRGGDIEFFTYTSSDYTRDYAPAQNFIVDAMVNLDGGAGANGGNGGAIETAEGCEIPPGPTGVLIAGTISANGGAATGASGVGGSTSRHLVVANGHVELSDTLTAVGGASASGAGGRFVGASFIGSTVAVSGTVTVGGGAGTPSGAASDVIVYSLDGNSSVTGSVSGGAGTTPDVRVDTGSLCGGGIIGIPGVVGSD